MPHWVDDFALVTLRFTETEYHQMPPKVRELLQVYHSREWREGQWIAMEIASHRMPEIEAAMGVPLIRLPDSAA